MSKELVFNVANVFNAETVDGALYQHSAKHYYIPPYQRGYKWLSFEPDDAVCILMRDLLDHYQTKGEYYLQFITTKKTNVNEEDVLELIDGQQRLTTLTLLLSVINYRLKETEHPLSNQKLSYRVRPFVTTFFESYIYRNIDSIVHANWETFIAANQDFNEQDIYYLFHSIVKINSVLKESEVKPGFNLKEFLQYVKEQVKIILNNIESKINCEKVFSNLNDNKVELTNAELIKGLFLTKTAREKEGAIRRSYKEVTEIRAVMGRRWDEIAHWTNGPDVASFFFPEKVGALQELLLLLGLQIGFQGKENVSESKELFNFFQSEIKQGKSANELFFSLKKLQQLLNDWFQDSRIYNTIGFLIFARSPRGKFTIKDLLPFLEISKSELKLKIKQKANDLLNEEIDDLEYGDDSDAIFNILLALNTFIDDKKFDFVAFSKNKWSLEHVFPQNPEKVPSTLGPKDIALFNSLLSSSTKNIGEIEMEGLERDAIKQIFDGLQVKLTQQRCETSQLERTLIYKLIKTDKLNSIGNLVFLNTSTNSSNGNGMFDFKRYNIVRKISQGHFVPKHTYDVFSKLLSDKMDADLTVWTERDIIAHQEWIKERIAKIKK